MTPRERQDNARRAARREPIYEAIGFVVVLLIAALAGGPFGLLIMLGVGAALLFLGFIVGIVQGPAGPPKSPDRTPPS